MTQEIKIILYAALIIIIPGILPSLFFYDWEWFSRSGSLLVIYGVYIAWQDYKGNINTGFSRVSKAIQIKHDKAILEIKENEKGIIKSVIEQGKAKESFYSELELLKEFRTLKLNTYEKIEFLIILIGTIIWGYGNLFNLLRC